MTGSRPGYHPDLDLALETSRPPTPFAESVSDTELADLVTRAREESVPASMRWSSRRRTVPIAAAIVVGLGGVGAAAAAVTDAPWSPWAQDPDVVFSFTLPSGAVCEQRIGEVQGADPEVLEAAREFFRHQDVLALADVDAEISRMRQETNIHVVDGAGNLIPAPYGSDLYHSPDYEYFLAVSTAVGNVFLAELEANGVDLESDEVVFGGETQCPGAQW